MASQIFLVLKALVSLILIYIGIGLLVNGYLIGLANLIFGIGIAGWFWISILVEDKDKL